MKVFKRSISIVLAAVFLLSLANFNAVAEENDRWEHYRLIHSAEYYFREIEEPLCFENVNGSDFIYIVRDNEAVLLSFKTNFKGPEMSVFTLPTVLGGYPVTAIGYETEDGTGVNATWYIHYGEDPFEKYPEYLEYGYYPVSDPGLRYVSEIIIPEGYKYIEEEAFGGVTRAFGRVEPNQKIVFPKSLREIHGAPFARLYTHEDASGRKYTVLPECQYSDGYEYDSYYITVDFYGPIYFPSRLGSEWLLDRGQFYPTTLYIPSNYSYETIRYSLFQINVDDSIDSPIIGDKDKGFGEDTIIHCAPDCEFLELFSQATELNYYTVITDVVPAEYIEFPEETVNVCVGDVVDLEAKTYPAEAVWTACDYTVSDPSIVQIDDYSGRITALKEGTVTVTATHCERGFVDTCTVNVITEPEPVSGINEIKPATDTPYFAYGNRDYKLELTGSPSKIQVVRKNGTTTTIDRSKAQITSNGETETWIVNMRVEAGEHSIRAKYGKVWDEKSVPFTVTYDTPKAYSFDLTYENGIGTFDIVTDPQIAKIQLVLDNGATLTYSQSYSYIGEDGLRHWTVTRKASVGTNYTLKTKLGYTWTTTDLKATT